MSERSKKGSELILILLLGMVLGGLGSEMMGEGGRIVEEAPCPEPPEVLECTLICPEPVCEAPVVEIPEQICICSKATEYGCLHELRTK